MMPTDVERRQVAANIRNAADRAKDDLHDDPDYSPFAALYVVFCGVRGWPHYEDLLHLADLIEPMPQRTCRNVGGERWNFKCSECGGHTHGKPFQPIDEEWRTVEEKLGGRVVAPHGGVPSYCPYCGAKVVKEGSGDE